MTIDSYAKKSYAIVKKLGKIDDNLHPYTRVMDGHVPAIEQELLEVKEEVENLRTDFKDFSKDGTLTIVDYDIYTKDKNNLALELADVIITSLTALTDLGFEPQEVLLRKLSINEKRCYPSMVDPIY